MNAFRNFSRRQVLALTGASLFSLRTYTEPSDQPLQARSVENPPELYFYPPPYVLKNNDIIASPLTSSLDQITELFPIVEGMSGVVMNVTWTQLQPTRQRFELSLIQQSIAYWHLRAKKIVLGVSTSGPPIESIQNEEAVLTNHAPPWVFQRIGSYSAESSTIGNLRRGLPARITTTYPIYWDGRLLREITPLVAALGRELDGNPGLSYVRIGTGIVAEDSPAPFGPHADNAPGFTFLRWIAYTRAMVDLYRSYFPRTQLELDVSYLPWSFQSGTQEDQEATNQLVDYLIEKNIFLTFDGLQAKARDWVDNAEKSKFPLDRVMHYLYRARLAGRQVGLEAVGTLEQPNMQDIASIAAAFNSLQAHRLVLFGTDAGAINYKRLGPNPSNASTVRWMEGRSVPISTVANHGLDLISRIGRQI